MSWTGRQAVRAQRALVFLVVALLALIVFAIGGAAIAVLALTAVGYDAVNSDGSSPAQSVIEAGAYVVAMALLYGVARWWFRGADRRDDFARFTLLSSAQLGVILTVSAVGGILLHQFAPGSFAAIPPDEEASEAFLFAFDNLFKVLFFDIFEVFEINMTSLTPTDALARSYTLAMRLLMTLTIAKHAVEFFDLDSWPTEWPLLASRRFWTLLGLWFVIALAAVAVMSALF